ncbi:ATP-binding protein [Candidatus Peregrinibacteria bacterium]|nr:ATP-binding protein [Candidatus Peregrinibacteria bacterium]
MIKDIILEQKLKREEILRSNYINREKSADIQTNGALDNKLIKVVIGPRRAGKSFFAAHIFKPNESAYINFDDERISKIKNYDDILDDVFSVYGNTKFLLFDEIQNMRDWELFANRLQRYGYNLMLTGSNAKLLSKDLATHLTGRYQLVELMPFNFREFLRARNFHFSREQLALAEVKGAMLNHLENFIRNGGFPELVTAGLSADNYLNTLLESLLFRDVVKRYRLRFSQKIYDLELYLINNIASEFSYDKLCRKLKFTNWATLTKYVGYLEEAYLIFGLSRYSHKAGERLSSPKKAYVADNGYISAKAVQSSPNYGKLMENLVFTELVKSGCRPNFDLFYYKTRNGKEVDFAVRRGAQVKSLIQAAYQADDIDVQKREVRALAEAAEELNCQDLMVLTWDYEAVESLGDLKVKFVPIWKWLLCIGTDAK